VSVVNSHRGKNTPQYQEAVLGSGEADTGINIGNINCPTTATHTINLAVGNGTHRYFAAPIYIYSHSL
jgi:hypothetical protein